jgi:hypothetical protein
MQDKTITRGNGWFTAWNGQQLMMMSADSSAYLSLSGSGGRIWELLEQPQTLASLCQALAAEYLVDPADIRGQVQAFLERLRFQHAIELLPSIVA